MGVIVYIFVAVVRFLNFIIVPFIQIFEPKKQIIEPITDKLLRISATKLAKLIRQKKVSSENVIRSYITRIKAVNHMINAVVEERFEKALEEAKFVDAYLCSTILTEDELRRNKPLLGVPFTVKASCQLSGMDYSVGIDIRKGIKADTDGYAVAKMKASGAIPLLVSNTPEACMSWYCNNKLTGTTCNPYDVTRSSGGSSGGEGALLGAGASVIGIGSDLAGSIRIPAMWCGVFGHKPTSKTVSMEGHFPYPTGETMLDYFTIGPMTRYAEDLKLLMDILITPGANNHGFHQKVDLSQLRVYSMTDVQKSFITSEVDNEIKKAIEIAAQFLVKSCNCSFMKKNNFEKCLSNSFLNCIFLLCQLGGISSSLEMENRNVMIELIKTMFGRSKFTFCYLSTVLIQKTCNFFYQDKYKEMNENLKNILLKDLRNDAVLILPSNSCIAPKHGESFLKMFSITYLPQFNTIGFPATQVPCGKGYNGLPIGLQVIAGPNQDRLCLAVAEELEKCFGGWIPPHDS